MSNQAEIYFPVHANSLSAWYEQVVPTLPERRRLVFEAIKTLGKATLQDVSLALNRPLNALSGRLTELKRAGLIKEVGKKQIGESKFSVYEVNNEEIL